MTITGALLAILPAFVLAAPAWNRIQYVYSPKDTLAQTKIYADSAFPVEVAFYLSHQRGNDPSTKSAHHWDYTPAGTLMEGEFPVTFETTRKDWDRWQAAFRFRDPDWWMWTDQFSAVLGEEHAGGKVGFTLGTHGVATLLSGGGTNTDWTIAGSNFPKEAIGINSFLLLGVRNDFTELSTSVSVELMTRSNEWWQDQTFIQEKGNNNVTYLPFFFERNATKDYNDLFNFKVSRHGGRSLTATSKPCELLPEYSGYILLTNVNSTGWSIWSVGEDLNETLRCSGKWDGRKNGLGDEDDEDDVEEL